MAKVEFTQNLKRHVDTAGLVAPGQTVRDVLESAFAQRPGLRDYVVDEHFALRKHVNLFVDGRPVADRVALSDPVRPEAELYIMQALSGG